MIGSFALVLLSLVTPAGAGSSAPVLASSPDGSLVMAWVEPDGKNQALRFARLKGGKWSAPQTIVSNERVTGGWANGPSISASADGSLLALWTEKSEGGHHAVDALIATSRDGGATWGKAAPIHGKTKPSEYGFASTVTLDRGFGVAWLDGRDMKSEAEGGMTLRFARVAANGKVSGEKILDNRVCECCSTGMTVSSRGAVIAYRDRGDGEIRDIAVVSPDGKPRIAHRDNWQIKGCPVNGPQLDGSGSNVALAWFTGADNQGRVQFALSRDGGSNFGDPVRIDDGKPSGRADVVLLRDGSALVTWIEGIGEGATLRARRVSASGQTAPSIEIAKVGAARMIPRLALGDGGAYVAWTEDKQVRVAAIPLQ
jgi:hypothetical protein